MEKQQGLFSKVMKVILVIIFAAIGAALITVGAVYMAKKWDQDFRWLSILNIVFGCLLLTSPYFLRSSKNATRGNFEKILRVIMVIIFIAIAIVLIAGGIYALVKYPAENKALPIVNIVFGALLLISPAFLKW